MQGSASKRQRSSCSGRDCLCSVGEMPSGEAETGGPEWRRSGTERSRPAPKSRGVPRRRHGARHGGALERATRPQRTSAIHSSSPSGAGVPSQRCVLSVIALFTAGNSCAPSGSPANMPHVLTKHADPHKQLVDVGIFSRKYLRNLNNKN